MGEEQRVYGRKEKDEMIIKKKVRPLPTEEYLKEEEGHWEKKLPENYRKFLLEYNGGIPVECSFMYNKHEYMVERFLSVLIDHLDNPLGYYDIEVITTQIGGRLTDEPDEYGLQKIPIAVLFAGDFVCLDYKENLENPSVCIWYHDESSLFKPFVKKIANNFDEFIDMLYIPIIPNDLF